MERAGRVLAKLKLAKHGVTDEQLARAAWPLAVGKVIAGHTTAVSLVRTRIVVEVGDTVWRSQLMSLRYQIVQRMEQVLGRRIVEEVEFRIGIPRRQPGRAEERTGTAPLYDEADAIRDPVFRSIYKSARKKATA